VTSFFFSRGGGDVSHAGKFVGSIATQLGQKSPAFRNLLQEAISTDEGIANRILKDQWRELILRPLSQLEAGSFRAPLLTVIDALDECERECDVRQVLQLLSDVQCLKGVQYRIFITSRPETPIRHGFSQVPDDEHQDFVLHDIPRSTVDHDISIFLERNLTDTRRKWSLHADWPGEQAVRLLVRKAAGLFIWAATTCRFVEEGRGLAAKRLSLILRDNASVTKPEEELNKIYITVLENSISDHFDEHEKEYSYGILRETLGAIVILFSPLSTLSLAGLLPISKEEVEQALDGLHSILDIPKDSTRPVRLHHPSLRDFLLDPQRCRDPHFWVDERIGHEELANRCIQLMSEKLKRDICGLHAPGARATEVSLDKIEHCLSAELQYACGFWVRHLQRSQAQLDEGSRLYYLLQEYWVQYLQQCGGHHDDESQAYTFFRQHILYWLGALTLIWGLYWAQRLQRRGEHLNDGGPVHTFLRQHMLHWLEALSLVGKISEGVRAIQLLKDIVDVSVS
jgi:hypothetical protein